MPFRIGPWEIALILMIILIIFGVGKLPEIGGAIGKGLKAFRKGQSGEDDEDETRVSKSEGTADNKYKAV
ncbi:MAG: twin-arginine translocase TatA/TatE family subunit [Dehalococcoidales bacterium]